MLISSALNTAPYTMLTEGDSRIPSGAASSKSLYIAFAKESLLVIRSSPLVFELFQGSNKVLTLNENSLLHFEHKREQKESSGDDNDEIAVVDRHHGKEIVDYGEDGLAVYSGKYN